MSGKIVKSRRREDGDLPVSPMKKDKRGGPSSGKVPSHKKYPKYDRTATALDKIRVRPSVLLSTLSVKEPTAAMELRRPPPEIVEFLNIRDYSSNIACAVDIDEPLFQPYPMEITFLDYEPYGTYTETLYLRNNDTVARRVKVLPPDSMFFSISAPRPSARGQKILDGKVASGMEVAYTITFKPHEKKDYSYKLICATEREKFAVTLNAPGPKGFIDFPDEIVFDTVPVKYEATTTIMVRNVGEVAVAVRLTPDAPFTAVLDRESNIIGVGEAVQVHLTFLPEEARLYEGEMVVEYDNGMSAYVRLAGSGENVAVHLSRHMLHMDPAYISLTSTQTFKVFNRSDVPVTFDWKSFSSIQEENAERVRLNMELSSMESAEREALDEMDFVSASASPSDDGDLSDDEGIPSAKRVELMALNRKYANLRKEVGDDVMHYTDETFVISPISGTIWANSEILVTVTFSPNTAANYACVAFLEITGRDTRLPLKLEGQGIGPKASFSYDVLDIGDVFVKSRHLYELVLENKGDIPASYSLDRSAAVESRNFRFSPSEGYLEVGESRTIEVSFASDILGEFSEHFLFALQGSTEKLAVHFKGHIVGPTFHFDVDKLDYGIVAYEFLNTKELNLINSSEIPMTFHLRIPQDGKVMEKEFDIRPSSGVIPPGGISQAFVDLISTTVKVYDIYLTVDVDGVGEGLLSVPIYATCQVPNVTLVKPELDFEECFLRYPYSRRMVLKNNSNLHARYELREQDERSQAVGTYNPDSNRGIIDPLGERVIEVNFKADKLGNIKLPLTTVISGSKEPPLICTLSAKGKGPNMLSSVEAVDFGSCQCLIDTKQKITLTNDSLIPAPFKTLVNTAKSRFKVDIKDGVMKPGESLDLQITVNPDDKIALKDQLHIVITEGTNIVLEMSAKGVGTTLFCEEDISKIDFGHQFTNHVFEKTILIENKGRRAQVLSWVNITAGEREKEFKLLKASAGATKKGTKKKKEGEEEKEGPAPVAFQVTPETVELRPRTACHFTIRGTSTHVGHTVETLRCDTKMSGEKKPSVALDMELSANIFNPVLQPSEPIVNFSYTWDSKNPAVPQSKPLTFTNVTALPLDFVLRTAIPFSLDQWEFHLEPAASATVNVEFDPGYKDDSISHVAKGKINAIYSNHPQKDSFDLVGAINFPNLEFEFTTVDFGCILNDTTKSMTMKVKNISTIDCAVNWSFMEDEEEQKALATVRKPYIPINEVFDILPIRSLLRPGETENIEFIYYGHKNRKFGGNAICEVEGGPEYEVTLAGEASNVTYRLDQLFLDFGPQLHSKQEEKEFQIHNTGKVAFNFLIRTDLIARLGVVAVAPATGRVFAKTSQRIQVRFRAGIPDFIAEKLLIEIAHFEPIEFHIYGQGIFATISVTLPLEDRPNWEELKSEAKLLLEKTEFTAPSPPSSAKVESASNSVAGGLGATIGSQPSRVGLSTAGAMSTVSSVEFGDMTSDGMETDTMNVTAASAPPTAPAIPTMPMAPRPPRELTSLMIDMEAMRLDYRSYLLAHEASVRLEDDAREKEKRDLEAILASEAEKVAAAALKAVESDDKEALSEVLLAATPPSAPASPSKGKKTKKKKAGEDEYVIAKYTVDLGNVIVGTTKKKIFKVTNAGSLPVSFTMDKKSALACGFTIEPEKVARLPEGTTTEFKIQFQASKRQSMGPLSVDIPINIREGPPVILRLCAFVTMPDIAISPDNLDFGRLLVGHMKVISVMLHNKSPVVAEWSYKNVRGSSRDSNKFVMTPSSGSLAPDERVNVEIAYTPTDGRKHTHKMPIKVNQNPRQHVINCKGSGSEVNIAFSPMVAELGPMLPYAAPLKQVISMTNDSDYAVEIYSLEFDTEYAKEEEFYRNLTGWDAEGQLRLPVREPGAGVQRSVLDAEAARLKLLEPPSAVPEPVAVAATPVKETAAPAKAKEAAKPDPKAKGGKGAVVEAPPVVVEEILPTFEEILAAPWSADKRGRVTDLHTLIAGPPKSGKSTLAAHLVATYGYSVLSFTAILANSISKQTPMGKRLARLQVPTIVDGVEVHAKLPQVALAAVLKEYLQDFSYSRGLVIDGLHVTGFHAVEEDLVGAVASVLGDGSIGKFSLLVLDITQDDLVKRASAQAAAALASAASLVEVTDASDPSAPAPVPPVALPPINPVDFAWPTKDVLIASFQGIMAKALARKEELRVAADAALAESAVADVVTGTAESKGPDAIETAAVAPEEAEVVEDTEATLTIPLDLIQVNANGEIEAVKASVVSALPIPPPLPWIIPEPVTSQLMRRPAVRPSRRVPSHFQLVHADDAVSKKFRWVLGPHESTNVTVQFASKETGRFDFIMGFEVVGNYREYSLSCRGVCGVPTINDDPRNIYMSRIKNIRNDKQIVNKKFVLSDNEYEFGALLVGKNSTIRTAAVAAKNAETFRISNNSLFDADIELCFAGAGTPFYVEPEAMVLPQGETKNVTVWAFPSEVKSFKDTLVACIKHNPTPISFPVRCSGVKPLLELHGPWEDAAALVPVVAEVAVAPTAGAAKKTPRDTAPPAGKSSEPLIAFERLLLGQQDDRRFTLHNPCKIAVAWQLNLGKLATLKEFYISPQSGIIEPFGTVTVSIGFTAITEIDYGIEKPLLIVEYNDAEGGLVAGGATNVSLPMRVAAEAYQVTTSTVFAPEDASGSLNFGSLRVGASAVKTFKLQNKGKYSVDFNFTFKRPGTEELFLIEPRTGSLASGAEISTKITFTSTKEVRLVNNRDIKCNIIESKTKEHVRDFDLTLTVRSVFDKFRLQPLRGVNFGAVHYGEERSKRFELKNNGDFDFHFRIVPLQQAQKEQKDREEKIARNEAVPNGGTGVPPWGDASVELLTIGQFTVKPARGKIAPGENVAIEIIFAAKGDSVYRESIRVDVSNRDFVTGGDAGLIYDVVGESCVPGINAEDYESIFEEQAVIRELSTGKDDRPVSVYSLDDHLFCFGHVVPTARPQGIQQRFKISNPFKVRAMVKYSMTPRNDKEKAIFTVQPEMDEIPPHEHRYVSVFFKPTSVQKYQAIFKAIVDKGTNTSTCKLEFDVTGEGTLPSITVVAPLTRTPTGDLLLDFGKLQAHKSRGKPLVLKNNGIISATVQFDMPLVDAFYFNKRGSSLTLEPGQTETLEISFQPKDKSDAPLDALLKMTVLQNSYETTKLLMKGIAFLEVVTFEDLPEEREGELVFADQILADDKLGQSVPFFLKNHTADPIKFTWGNHADFKFSPNVGHLAPYSTKHVTGTFRSSTNAKVSYNKVDVPLAISTIKYSAKVMEEGMPEWDDRMKEIRYIEGPVSATGLAGEKTTKEETIIIPEPENAVVGLPRNVNLQCTARADNVSFACSVKAITFAPTLMFQTRSHKFTLNNTSTTAMKVDWAFENQKNSSWFDSGRPNTAKSVSSMVTNLSLPCPFVVEPSTASIPAGASQSFTVKFAPAEVDDYRYTLAADVDHMPAGMEQLVIGVRGKAQRPVCHMDIEPSDYLSRRALDMPNPTGEKGPLDGDVKVLEFTSLGLRVKNTKRFFVLNPTNISYEFTWEPEGGVVHPAFRCLTRKGLVLSGNRAEMVFEFTPGAVETAESFWRFSIPSQEKSVLFLLVGTVAEPKVRFDRVHINFRELLLGGQGTEIVKLVNSEHIPFSFAFDKSSFNAASGRDAAGERQVISIVPSSGVVPPDSSLPIEVTFSPSEEKLHNYNLKCIVMKKPLPLSLNVKGEGYAVHDSLLVEDVADSIEKQTPLSAINTNFIDFGTAYVNEKSVKPIIIHNTGKFGFDYSWKGLSHPMLAIEPSHGTVRPQERVSCQLVFMPMSETSLDGQVLTCTVAGGARTYKVAIGGRSSKPALDFSFYDYNFGPVFAAPSGVAVVAPERTVLRIANNEVDTDLNLECLFEKLPYLDVQCPPTVLRPGAIIEIPILFSPREFRSYKEVIPFEVNNLITMNVVITGEGCHLKVELANPMEQDVAFGAVRPGEEASRLVRLVNRSKRAATFSLIDKVEAGVGLLAGNAVSIYPSRPVTLKPREMFNVELKFAPTSRIAPFSEEVDIVVEGGRPSRLVRVTGACQGMEIRLESDAMPFGPVCINSMLTRKLLMMNTGDVAANFKWDTMALAPDFTITPANGHIAAHAEIMFEVTFAPKRVNDDIRYDSIRCYIDGLSPLLLTVMGSCLPQPDKDILDLNFVSKVRESASQSITIKNPTKDPWSITPVISNSYWTAPETVNIAALGSAAFNLTFTPLTMTSVEDAATIAANPLVPPSKSRPVSHEGSLFFALPDGTALMYKLHGKALPPAMQALPKKDTFVLTTPAKKPLTVALPVVNWLKATQHFTVKIIPAVKSLSTLLRGADFLDIPPGGARDYKLTFNSYQEGATKVTVVFTNAETGEFVFYELALTAGPPGVVEEISIKSIVRQTTKKLLTIENPLPKEEAVRWLDGFAKCEDPTIRVTQVGTMTGAAEGVFQIEYRPIVASDKPKAIPLVLTSPELGTYKYVLNLQGAAASAERNMRFTASLGASQLQTFRFRSFLPKASDYAVSVTQPACFLVKDKINAAASDKWDGVEVAVEVMFVPNTMGLTRDTLRIFSADGGEYLCTLVGECTAPVPQGPFIIAKGASETIAFKNVFSESREFEYVLDSPVFTCAEVGKKIDAKASVNIVIKYVPQEGARSAGRLLVRCKDSDMAPWVFYLQGGV